MQGHRYPLSYLINDYVLGELFKILESNNKIFELSPNIVILASEYNISGKHIEKLRSKYAVETYNELNEFTRKKLIKEQSKLSGPHTSILTTPLQNKRL